MRRSQNANGKRDDECVIGEKHWIDYVFRWRADRHQLANGL